MAIREFLAKQKASFVSLSDLLEQIEAAEDCTLREACQVFFSYMAAAGDQAPAWLKWDKRVGPVEAEGKDLVMAELGPAWIMSELGDPGSSLLNRHGKTANDSHREVLRAQKDPRYGFDGARAYSLLRSNGVHLPEAVAVLGASESDAGAGGSASRPLTLEEKREIVRLRAEGMGVPALAEKFRKSRKTIYNVLNDAKSIPLAIDPTIVSRRG